MREQEADNKIVRSSTGKRWRRLSTYALPIVVSVFGVVLAGSTSAWGTADDPFTPAFSVSTSTTQAGAHPDVTINVHKTPNSCPGFADQCPSSGPGQASIEQDLKKQVIHFPPGLAADANAAPYCDPYQDWVENEDQPGNESIGWFCKNPDALVGTAYIATAACFPPDGNQNVTCPQHVFGNPDGPPGSAMSEPGLVYNDRPSAGEQGHLVVLWPAYLEHPSYSPLPAWVKSDVSIRVRTSDAGVDSVADNLPDVIESVDGSCDLYGNCFAPYKTVLPGQLYDLTITLNGSTGQDKGHPLLTNPTLCDAQSVDADLQGYAHNSRDIAAGQDFVQGSGEGKDLSASVSYSATGCDSVPYNPKLSISLNNQGPDQAPAISTTITQASGEATTKTTTVTYPKAFKINAQNKSSFCSDADLAASTCPENSRVGAASASSPLLPIGQSLAGNVYLTGLTSDSIKMSILLSGFISLRIDGTGKINGDGTVTTTFDNQPATPVSEFKLNLEGGDKGLLKTPKTCGPQGVTATFTSHSGKSVQSGNPIEIQGCSDPKLDASLSPRVSGKSVDLALNVSSAGTAIKSIRFVLPSRLRWGIPGNAGRGGGSRSVGSVTVAAGSGERSTHFAAKALTGGGLRLSALAPRGPRGTVGASELPDFSGTLVRGPDPDAKSTHGRGRSAKRVEPGQFALAGLPEDGSTAVGLSLNGRSRHFTLRVPKACGLHLDFLAIVDTAEGRHLVLKDRVRPRGRGC